MTRQSPVMIRIDWIWLAVDPLNMRADVAARAALPRAGFGTARALNYSIKRGGH